MIIIASVDHPTLRGKLVFLYSIRNEIKDVLVNVINYIPKIISFLIKQNTI